MKEEIDESTVEETGDGLGESGVRTPAIDDKGKVTRSAFRDGKQAWSVYRSLEDQNQTRTSINAEIVARHMGKPPHDQKELEAHAQNWRSNFPTLALMGIEGRITARLVSTVDNARVLTNSHLPESFDDHDDKSKKFQQRITSYIRRWRGWRPFVSALCSEDVLIGYAIAALTDDYNWRPRLFRSDEAFLPQGCAQFPEYVQVVGLKQSFLIHECVQWIEDKEAAEVAGYQVDSVIESTNKAQPRDRLSEQTGAGNISRAYQDLVREGSTGDAYAAGAKGVDTALVFGIEPDSRRITQYIIDRINSNATLFFKKDRFEGMGDVISMFTLEPGNSTYYGSKGVGRKAVNITVAQDVTANDAVDAYRLSSQGILKTDAKSGISTQLEIMNPFVVVKSDATLEQQRFQFNADGFIRLYGQLGYILESAVGDYISNLPNVQDPNKNKTATAENIDYQREQQQTIAFVARFLGQLFDLIASMQKRMCDSETVDEDAKQLQKELEEIDGLTKEEIGILAKSPTAEVVQDLASQRNQQIDIVAQRYGNHPNIDKLKLMNYDIAALSSPQIADELVLPDGIDPTIQAEQVRQQIQENDVMQGGNSINISPRDNDEEHLKVIIGELDQAMPKLMQKPVDDPDLPQLMDNINAVLIHAEAHLKNWSSKVGPESQSEIVQFEQKIRVADQQLTKMGTVLRNSRQARMKHQQVQATQNQARPQMAVPQNSPQSPPKSGGMTEKVLTSWITQYPNLPDPEKRKLEQASGLGALNPNEAQVV